MNSYPTLDDLIDIAADHARTELAARDDIALRSEPTMPGEAAEEAPTALLALLKLLDSPPRLARTVTLRRDRTPDSR